MYTAAHCHIEGGSAPDAEDNKYPKTGQAHSKCFYMHLEWACPCMIKNLNL